VLSSSSRSPTGSARILLVDDNRLGLIARKNVLEELGYSIVTASDSRVALELFDMDAFDLVVTDYKMPHMNGKELIARMRETKKDVSVILISGFVDTLGLSEANTGADAVIQKSSNEVQHLVRAVARLLRRKVTPKKPPSGEPGPVKSRRKSV
jgi:CheY-like chemotaxis protein